MSLGAGTDAARALQKNAGSQSDQAISDEAISPEELVLRCTELF